MYDFQGTHMTFSLRGKDSESMVAFSQEKLTVTSWGHDLIQFQLKVKTCREISGNFEVLL